MTRNLIRAFALLLLAVAGPTAAHHPAGRAATMAQKAQNFLASLTPEQRAQVTKPLDDSAARTNWHYLPASIVTRDGLPLAALGPEARGAAHALFATALSSQGNGKAAQIMWLEDVLRPLNEAQIQSSNATGAELESRRSSAASRDSGNYWIVMFGSPGAADWGWTISGHHLAVNFTVASGRIAFTPLFVGAAPQTVDSGRYAGWRTLQHEIDKGVALIASLDTNQRAAAVRPEPVPITLIADQGQRKPTVFVGISADRLSAEQQELLMTLIDEYVGDAAGEAAVAQIAAIRRDGMKALRFAESGNGSET